MCGITGRVDVDRGLQAERSTVGAMTATMICRGPGRRRGVLLDRKDRLSMASGLEVRVPFRDHRLFEYVWSVPWPMKRTGGIEKGLRRAAAAGMLPDTLLSRRKSICPGVASPAYAAAIDTQMRVLLARPDAPVFALVGHGKLAAAYAANPTLAGYQAIQPSSKPQADHPVSCALSFLAGIIGVCASFRRGR
jgi:asparagine synthetase B (glutamine-hydrolysing)